MHRHHLQSPSAHLQRLKRCLRPVADQQATKSKAKGKKKYKVRDRQVIMRPAQDVKEALLGGILELAMMKLPAKQSRKGTIKEGSSAAPQADIGFDKHRFQSLEHQ